jgi:hypothetical protein
MSTPPRRLTELSPGAPDAPSPELSRAGALFRAGRSERAALSPEALARVELRLRAGTAVTGMAAWVKALWGAGLIAAGAVTWGVVRGPAVEPVGAQAVAVAVEVETAPGDPLEMAVAPEQRGSTQVPEVQVPRRDLPRLDARPAAAKAPAPQAARASAPAPGPGSDGALGREAASLGEVLRTLREQHQPAAALVLLERHEAAHPHGQLRAEAFRARLDALRAVGRTGEAVEAIREARRTWPEVGGTLAMEVLEGELLAASSRCREGLSAFEAVLRRDAAPSLHERAWAGRARCRHTLGDVLGAKTDAQRYLSLFPEGRFRPAMEALAEGS